MNKYPPIGTLIQLEWLDACFSSDRGPQLSESEIADLKIERLNWGVIAHVDADGMILKTADQKKVGPSAYNDNAHDYWFIPHGMVRKITALVPVDDTPKENHG